MSELPTLDTPETAAVDGDTVERIVAFHGQMCPRLALGIQAAQIALRELGPH